MGPRLVRAPMGVSRALGFVSTAAGVTNSAADAAAKWSKYVQDLAEEGFRAFEPRVGETVEVNRDGSVARVIPIDDSNGGPTSPVDQALRLMREYETELWWAAAVLAGLFVLRTVRK